ncbi:hypothetical protein F53441_2934 [Fusarium austroafricanum]|uniref:DRBM domain-containing protein n=1 Tax=Fusarium austroafricanum TaxID=2364996 RepID=A0A8H4P3E4_9HYPO|nr:hypothetical protein F53441_2934 [Fusarium austroafricanum]
MASDGRVPWDELIKFAEEKKVEEAESGKPAQLSKQQIAAVSQLIELVHDIEVEDFWFSDHVCLVEFCQQNKHAVPTFTSETFNQLVSGIPVPRSRVFCILPSQNQKFPQEGRGYEAGQEVPTFKKAQKAKNFAAMHALKYLRNEDSSPRGSKRAASGTQESPAHTRIKAEEDNSDGGVSTGGPSLSRGKSAPARTSSNFTTQGPTIRERAAGLGCRLGFGIPEYHIEQDNEEEDTWSGRPIFKNDGRIPEDVGVVTGVVGRQQAEILVAEKVLEWLEKEEKAKQDQVASILSSTP